MAEFTKLGAVEAVETVSETANVLIEEDGVIKRAPKTAVGGSGDCGTELVLIDTYNKIIRCGNLELTYTGEGSVYYFNDETVAKELCTLLMDYTKNFKFVRFNSNSPTRVDYFFDAVVTAGIYPNFKLGDTLYTVEEL